MALGANMKVILKGSAENVSGVLGVEHVSEEWRERTADDVWEARALGLHLPELRLHQPDPCPDQIKQQEARQGRGPSAVLWALRL